MQDSECNQAGSSFIFGADARDNAAKTGLYSRREFLRDASLGAVAFGLSPAYSAPTGRIITIFDDAGETLKDLPHIKLLGYSAAPRVYAIIPGGVLCDKVCEEIRKSNDNNLELLLHQPMESIYDNETIERTPRKPKETYDPSKHFGIYNFDSPELAQRILLNNIEYLDRRVGSRVLGLNNHMGSKVTQNQNIIKGLAEKTKEINLIFVDSYTHPRSVAYDMMRNAGVRAYRRNLWLDNEPRIPREEFSKAEQLALKGNLVIAIGHIRHESTVAEFIRRARKSKLYSRFQLLEDLK